MKTRKIVEFTTTPHGCEPVTIKGHATISGLAFSKIIEPFDGGDWKYGKEWALYDVKTGVCICFGSNKILKLRESEKATPAQIMAAIRRERLFSKIPNALLNKPNCAESEVCVFGKLPPLPKRKQLTKPLPKTGYVGLNLLINNVRIAALTAPKSFDTVQIRVNNSRTEISPKTRCDLLKLAAKLHKSADAVERFSSSSICDERKAAINARSQAAALPDDKSTGFITFCLARSKFTITNTKPALEAFIGKLEKNKSIFSDKSIGFNEYAKTQAPIIQANPVAEVAREPIKPQPVVELAKPVAQAVRVPFGGVKQAHEYTKAEWCNLQPVNYREKVANGHELAVIQALRDGVAVSSEVLTDYPYTLENIEQIMYNRWMGNADLEPLEPTNPPL